MSTTKTTASGKPRVNGAVILDAARKPRRKRNDAGKPRKKLSPVEHDILAWPSLTADKAAIASAVNGFAGETVTPNKNGMIDAAQPATPVNSVVVLGAHKSDRVTVRQEPTIAGELWAVLVHGTKAAELIGRALWRWANSKLAELK
jgi:hypothetical protein